MLVCLACPKQATLGTPAHVDEPHPPDQPGGLARADSSAAAPLSPSREHAKSLTTQIKDIVIKFSSGAYRHCRPCTAAGIHGGGADEDKYNLCGEDDAKSAVLLRSLSEDHSYSEHGVHDNLFSKFTDHSLPHESTGVSSDQCSSRYDLLPDERNERNKRRQSRKKKSSSASASKSSLFLKQLASRPASSDTIEQLLDEHFRREERIIAEEQTCESSGEGDREVSRSDGQLLEEVQLVGGRRHHHPDLIIEEHLNCGVDGHVKRSKRHKDTKGTESGEEWVAQVEPGVMITFVALPDGSNHLKRIRFSRELFSKWQAQLWWTENSDMVRELYSVRKLDPPFKPSSSARSSASMASSTTTTYSIHHQHALQNTPELQSRVGSYQASPSNTPRISRLLKESKSPLGSPPVYIPSTADVPSSAVTSADAPVQNMLEQHDNPLFDSPEFELCYNEGLKASLVLPNGLWVPSLEDRTQQWQEDKEALLDERVCSPCELVHELKRVKFNS